MKRLFAIWQRHRLLICGIVLTAAIAGPLVWQRVSPGPLAYAGAAGEASPAPSAAPSMITVDVEGAVAGPGLRKLPEGSLVEEGIAAAGGLTEAADAARIAKEVNRAEKLKDGQKLYVPIKGEVSASAGQSGQAGPTSEKINLNTATAEELDKLPGVGPSTAQKIIQYREQNGPFGAPEELKNVPGIGDAKYAQLQDQITV